MNALSQVNNIKRNKIKHMLNQLRVVNLGGGTRTKVGPSSSKKLGRSPKSKLGWGPYQIGPKVPNKLELSRYCPCLHFQTMRTILGTFTREIATLLQIHQNVDKSPKLLQGLPEFPSHQNASNLI